MMRCADVRAVVGFFLEKETEPLQTLQTRSHLDGCGACRSRAERLDRLMSDCAKLPQPEPPGDIAAAVMGRLRAMRAGALSHAGSAAALKWSGWVLLLGSFFSAVAGPAASWGLGKPASFLSRLISGADPGGGAREMAGGALPILARVLHGGLRSDLPAPPLGFDLQVTLQVLATGLAVAFMLAVPVALLAAWLLRSETITRHSTPLLTSRR